MRGTLSLIGLYQRDNTILDGIITPTGLDRENLIINIIMECAELEVLYPDPEFIKYLVPLWSAKEVTTWNRIYQASLKEYNPIENYDRIEEYTENETTNRDIENTGNSRTTTHNVGTDTNYINGYNSSEQVMQGATSHVSDGNNTGTATNTGNENTDRENIKSGRIHGNIGVTTSQQMLQQEVDIAPVINVYNYIIRSFKNRFCLMVYTG